MSKRVKTWKCQNMEIGFKLKHWCLMIFLSQFSGKMIKHNSRFIWKHEIPELANIVSGVCGLEDYISITSKFYNSADLEILFGFLRLSGERFKFF